jgi:predicted RNA-binding Zn ribbon-like protein
MPDHRGRIDTIRLVGGNVCLDFVNTANGRRTSDWLGSIEENLRVPRDVVIWAQRTQLIGPGEDVILTAAIDADPRNAEAHLAALIGFRDRLHQLFEATVSGSEDREGTRELDGMLARTLRYRHLEQTGGRFQWAWDADVTAENLFDRILGRVALAAADLLTSENLHRLRMCSSHDCDWLFLDTSKAGRRRWCQMDVCGNRAKARRHAEHSRA